MPIGLGSPESLWLPIAAFVFAALLPDIIAQPLSVDRRLIRWTALLALLPTSAIYLSYLTRWF